MDLVSGGEHRFPGPRGHMDVGGEAARPQGRLLRHQQAGLLRPMGAARRLPGLEFEFPATLPLYFGAKFENCLFKAPYREPRLPPPDFIPEEHGVGVPLPPETESSGEVSFQDNFGGGVGYVKFPAKKEPQVA